jgi:hypothetical protein
VLELLPVVVGIGARGPNRLGSYDPLQPGEGSVMPQNRRYWFGDVLVYSSTTRWLGRIGHRLLDDNGNPRTCEGDWHPLSS